MFFPLWALFSLAAATCSAAQMLLQERFKANGFALSFWLKIFCIVCTLPMVLWLGFPQDKWFYILVPIQAVFWAVADVVYFNSLTSFGAGVVSRVLPFSIIFTFFLWLPFDGGLIEKYQAAPLNALGILAVLMAVVFFAFRLRRCPVTWPAVIKLIPMFLAAVVSSIFAKLVLTDAGPVQGPAAFIFIEALTMVALWYGYYKIRRPVAAEVLFNRHVVKVGSLIGVVTLTMIFMNLFAIHWADNPAYHAAVKQTTAVLVLVYYRLSKHQDRGNIWSGLGIVLCAMLLSLLG